MVPPAPAPDAGASPPLLDPELRAFLGGGVSVGIATCDAALRPHTVRAVGLRCAGAELRLLVPRAQARRVLEDVADNGRVAIVVSQPTTHRTVQLKGRGARIEAPDAADLARMPAYLAAFDASLTAIGFGPPIAEALLDAEGEPLVAIVVSPEHAFVATPGPGAGEPLGPRR